MARSSAAGGSGRRSGKVTARRQRISEHMFYSWSVVWKTAVAVIQAAAVAPFISLGVFGNRAIATQRCRHYPVTPGA
jgi:hypothetical protein